MQQKDKRRDKVKYNTCVSKVNDINNNNGKNASSMITVGRNNHLLHIMICK